MAGQETALIVGAGPGLGASLARLFAGDGMAVALAARKADTVEALAKEIGGKAYACDATEEDQVEALFEAVGKDLGTPDLVVYNAGTFSIMSVLETEADHFEQSWKINCLGGFFVGRAAAAAMKARGSGTIIFTGATASLRGGARFHNLAVGKFGLRALAQSMARELGPENIHVAHVIIDGVIDTERGRAMVKDAGPEGLLAPDAIAANYLHLHRQGRSAWTHELDVRPWAERF
jgi:NAD(P)-dependent dehydrogenase (short-subunit alcohol dehydrogenase family)